MNSKTKRLSIIVLLVLIFAGVAGTLAFKASHQHTGQTAKSEVYYCPMHPDYTSPRPGNCTICDMKLIRAEPQKQPAKNVSEVSQHKVTESSQCLLHNCPMIQEGKSCPMLVFADDGSVPQCPVCQTHLSTAELQPIDQPQDILGYSAISLPKARQDMIGLRLAMIEKKATQKIIRMVGRIAYDPQLYQAQEEYLQALNSFSKAKASGDMQIEERAQKLVTSSRIRLTLMGLNEDLIESLEVSKEADKSLILPQVGRAWMYAPVYEYDLAAVKTGQRVLVRAQNVLPGQVFEGVVGAVDPVIDEVSRSVNVRVRLQNLEGALKPNMYVNAELEVDLGEQVQIPESAVLDAGQRRIAFVAREAGVFEPRGLQLGPKAKHVYVVLSGVKAGERVVDQATFFVDSESKLKASLGGHDGH